MRFYKTFAKTLCICLMLILLTACNVDKTPKVEDRPEPAIKTSETINVLKQLTFTAEEQAYIDTLKNKGVLKIATNETKGTYELVDSNIKGYNYAAIKKFADELSIDLDVHLVDSLEDYFKHDGVFDVEIHANGTPSYTPDLFQEVDVYVDLLTPLPWREQLMSFVGFLPVREVIIHHNSMPISSTQALDGLTVAIHPATSYYNTIKNTALRHGLTLEYQFTDTVAETLGAIVTQDADFTLMDSNHAFLEIQDYDALSIGHPLTDIQYIGWAVEKDNYLLKSILDKYWEGLKSTGQFNDLWLMNYTVNYYDYYKLISNDLTAVETINFSIEEKDYIQQLQDEGTLKIALQNSKICYNIVDGEHQGFNYLLAKNLADSLGIELEVTIVDQFTTYFWENGETPKEIKTNPNFTYIPDLLKDVDIYTDNITHLPWRQLIFNQIDIVPAKAVFVFHSDATINRIEELDGKTIAINRDTSFESILQDIIKEYDIKVEIIDITRDLEGYDAVQNKDADATMIDSDLGLLLLQDYDNLVISFSASEISTLGWAVKKEDEVLASILSKYIDATKQNGRFEQYWNKTYDISYIEYLRLLSD